MLKTDHSISPRHWSIALPALVTLAAVYPHMTGIGGDGFWLICEPDGRVHSVHGCGGAAATANLSLYAGLEAVPSRGPLAANTVAGTISAWDAALASTSASLPLDRLLCDAIALAEAGVPVTTGGAGIAASKGTELRIQPGAYAASAICYASPCWHRRCGHSPPMDWVISTTDAWQPSLPRIWRR